jgi:hypothetical protein
MYNKDCDFDNPYDNYNVRVESFLNSPYGDSKIAVITTTNYYKRGGGFYLVQGDLHKIQFLLSSMVSEGDIFTTNLKGNQLKKFQRIYKTIVKYLKDKYEINYVKINQFETYPDGYIIMELCGWEWKDSSYSLEDIDKIVLKIISDNSIVFTCHSDETGPFAEDIGLTEINTYDLINEITSNETTKQIS